MQEENLEMTLEEAKVKHSKRIKQKQNHIKKQMRIAKAHNATDLYQREPHRLAKRHAMDCGQPECFLCGNPRKVFKQKTIQEVKFEQTEKWINYESEIV